MKLIKIITSNKDEANLWQKQYSVGKAIITPISAIKN